MGKDSQLASLLPAIPEGLELDPLLLALLQCTAFLDLSSDDEVQPDAAAEVLEHVGMYVQRMGDEELDQIESQIEDVVAHGKEAGWPTELVDFVSSFLENCGIVVDEDAGEASNGRSQA